MYNVTINDEILQLDSFQPHVLILGAGASRAACPTGDANGRKLPLLNDLYELENVQELLNRKGIHANGRSFEELYSEISGNASFEFEVATLNTIIRDYFGGLELPPEPTIYDHIVLSLRSKDVIASFNWDPLLLQAFVRNREFLGAERPSWQFLHGNVLLKYCEQDRRQFIIGDICPICKQRLTQAPLLFPLERKDYSTDPSIIEAWSVTQRALSKAFMMTVFGYSKPASDVDAVKLLRTAWQESSFRELAELEVIDIASREQLETRWAEFPFSNHDTIVPDVYESFLFNHPRRSGEAFTNQFLDAKFIQNNPIPRTTSFPELYEWFQPLMDVERANR